MNLDALAAILIAWIVGQTGLLAPPPPDIIFVLKGKILELAFGPNAPEGARIHALYNRNNKIIYLLEDWQPNDLRNKSLLLHELVHHVQDFNKVSMPCDAAREVDAYHLQFQWLRENGIEDPYAFLDTNELFVILHSVCLDNDTR